MGLARASPSGMWIVDCGLWVVGSGLGAVAGSGSGLGSGFAGVGCGECWCWCRCCELWMIIVTENEPDTEPGTETLIPIYNLLPTLTLTVTLNFTFDFDSYATSIRHVDSVPRPSPGYRCIHVPPHVQCPRYVTCMYPCRGGAGTVPAKFSWRGLGVGLRTASSG